MSGVVESLFVSKNIVLVYTGFTGSIPTT